MIGAEAMPYKLLIFLLTTNCDMELTSINNHWFLLSGTLFGQMETLTPPVGNCNLWQSDNILVFRLFPGGGGGNGCRCGVEMGCKKKRGGGAQRRPRGGRAGGRGGDGGVMDLRYKEGR